MRGIGRVLDRESIKAIVIPIAVKFGVTRVTLFGSYAKGTATSNSDLDLVVATNRHGFDFTEILAELFDALGYGNVDLYAEYELDEDEKLKTEIAKTGVIIYEAGE